MPAEIILALIGIAATPVAAWLSSRLTRQKYDTEIAKLRAEVASAKADANRKELENAPAGERDHHAEYRATARRPSKTTQHECFTTGKGYRQGIYLPSRC